VEVVSAVPNRVSASVLDQVLPGWPAAAEEPERRQLLEIDAAHVRFRHELARNVVLANLPAVQRRGIHGEVLAALLEAHADPADIVHHAEAAGDDDVLSDYALVAARRAAALESNREAYFHYRRAADFADRLLYKIVPPLKAGMTLKKTLEMVRGFRKDDNTTPLVLMGYYNPIYIYGVDKFLADAKSAGVDGLIIVDLPPEEDTELCIPAMKAGLNFIRLATPTTDDKRLPAVLANTSGFVYYVSITGITGSASADSGAVGQAVARIKRHTKLPVCVGFGIRTPDAARAIAENANGAVVGTALVDALRASLDGEGRATPRTVGAVADLVAALAQGVRGAKQAAE